MMGLKPRRELSQMNQNNPKPELQFYMRRQTQKNTINPNILLTIEQSASLNDGLSSSQGNSKLTPSYSFLFDIFDLDASFATRK